jgi:hypothetical protein
MSVFSPDIVETDRRIEGDGQMFGQAFDHAQQDRPATMTRNHLEQHRDRSCVRSSAHRRSPVSPIPQVQTLAKDRNRGKGHPQAIGPERRPT